ncbi:MAG: small, acid-soluble spore protein, alpha/beta type [Clostridiaceae bacterium]|jgi:small acid-soluble spore protein F (minor alpha/beta-type SASP)|nr:small, acid-soluble spore protein, alpha/beta type [Bacillota bacterium]NLP08666.1 small, acid-soluble spore protein, alpha/beta type [Clostridiaceae bacterium]
MNGLFKGGGLVSRRRSMMSEQLKQEIAKELGVYDTVEAEGWGAVSSRDCGNIVKKAIEMAERSLTSK